MLTPPVVAIEGARVVQRRRDVPVPGSGGRRGIGVGDHAGRAGAGLPPTHVGVAAGPVILQGGDYYGRTVNLASRISDRTAAGQVLVNELVVETTSIPDARFDSIGAVVRNGMPQPIELFEARRR
jgi:adenylate cyclase